MTPMEIKAARQQLALSAEAFAKRVGVKSGRTVRRWEAGDRKVPGSVAEIVIMILAENHSDGPAVLAEANSESTIAKAVARAERFLCRILVRGQWVEFPFYTLTDARGFRPHLEAAAANHRKALVYAVDAERNVELIPDSFQPMEQP